MKEALWEFFPDLALHPADCDVRELPRRPVRRPQVPATRPRRPPQAGQYRASGASQRKIDWAARRAGQPTARRRTSITRAGSAEDARTLT